jgi:hypothetical protein
MGTQVFCDNLGLKLKQENLSSVLDIIVPEKHNLPAFGFVHYGTCPYHKVVKTVDRSLPEKKVR